MMIKLDLCVWDRNMIEVHTYVKGPNSTCPLTRRHLLNPAAFNGPSQLLAREEKDLYARPLWGFQWPVGAPLTLDEKS